MPKILQPKEMRKCLEGKLDEETAYRMIKKYTEKTDALLQEVL